jgi:hypothetical protein
MIADLIAAYAVWLTAGIIVPLGLIAGWATLKKVLQW